MKRILNRILAMLLAAILLAAPVCAVQTGYTDVPENAWYKEAVQTVTARGWMDGTGEGKFSPNDGLTRAMLTTILWRMEDCPAAAVTGNFTDTVRGSWYDGGVSWCVAEGLFQGFPDGSFRPNDAVTREQLAVVFYRYADAAPTGAAAKVSVKNGCSWAADACVWANAEGLFTDALGTLDLCAPASRAEIAYWLTHFDVGTSASSLTEGSFEGLGYLLYTPENASKNLPLLVYLHGGHGKGSDLSVLLETDGFPKYLADGDFGEIPAYVLIPQLPASEMGWLSSADTVMALIESICEEAAIDRSRIALTGHSMGGTGTWDLALAYPDVFSRIAPMSGSVKTTADTLKTLKNMPIWAFVGEDDVVVKPESTETFIESVSKQNPDARVTVFEDTDHVGVLQRAWLENGTELLNWLLQ